MALFITSLNSGSNGNCYYIGNEEEAILVDAGISCRETEKRMNRLGLSMEKVKAIFVSHEHGDHITGVPGISKKFNLPVYITADTYRDSHIPIAEDLVYPFRANEPVSIGRLKVTAFSKQHDAVDPHSFIIEQDGVCVGVFTDIGVSCKQVIRYFSRCNALFLESNYCEQMLEKGNYPYFLKKRISDGKGHLSNTQALDLFTKHAGKNLSHLILSHLSKNNNCPELVERLFKEKTRSTEIIVASRYSESAVYKIEMGASAALPITHRPRPKKFTAIGQLSLFGE